MLIIGASVGEIEEALRLTNDLFGNNVEFKRFDADGVTRDNLPKYQVTLKVKDSYEPGHRMSVPRRGKRRHMVSACWHVHGEFMDALPEGTEIHVQWGGGLTIYPGDRWNDINIGGPRTYYMSEACECTMLDDGTYGVEEE